MEAVSGHAVEAAFLAVDQRVKADEDIRRAMCREREEAHYEASLASRPYEVVDPINRLVARELESRWNAALEGVAHIEERVTHHDSAAGLCPKIDRAALMSLEQSGVAPFDPTVDRVETIGADETVTRLGLCTGSVQNSFVKACCPRPS